MKQETHESRRKDRIPHPYVPSNPLLFQPVQLADINVRIELLSRLVGGGGHRRVEAESHEEGNKQSNLDLENDEYL